MKNQNLNRVQEPVIRASFVRMLFRVFGIIVAIFVNILIYLLLIITAEIFLSDSLGILQYGKPLDVALLWLIRLAPAMLILLFLRKASRRNIKKYAIIDILLILAIVGFAYFVFAFELSRGSFF